MPARLAAGEALDSPCVMLCEISLKFRLTEATKVMYETSTLEETSGLPKTSFAHLCETEQGRQRVTTDSMDHYLHILEVFGPFPTHGRGEP